MSGALASIRNPRSPVFAVAFYALAALAAYEVAQLILGGDINSLIYLAVLFAGAIGAVNVLNDWRKGVYLFIGWILFEDFVRKYVGNNMAMYFVKDVLVLLLYLSFFRALRARRVNLVERFRPPFIVPLLCFIFFGVMQVFNPNSSSLFYGLMGIKMYFLYVPLMYVSYYFIDSEHRLRSFLVFNTILILVVVCLGVAQAIIGPTFLNPATIQEEIRELSTTYRVLQPRVWLHTAPVRYSLVQDVSKTFRLSPGFSPWVTRDIFCCGVAKVDSSHLLASVFLLPALC